MSKKKQKELCEQLIREYFTEIMAGNVRRESRCIDASVLTGVLWLEIFGGRLKMGVDWKAAKAYAKTLIIGAHLPIGPDGWHILPPLASGGAR